MPTPTKGPRLGGSPAHQRHILANLATAKRRGNRVVLIDYFSENASPIEIEFVVSTSLSLICFHKLSGM